MVVEWFFKTVIAGSSREREGDSPRSSEIDVLLADGSQNTPDEAPEDRGRAAGRGAGDRAGRCVRVRRGGGGGGGAAAAVRRPRLTLKRQARSRADATTRAARQPDRGHLAGCGRFLGRAWRVGAWASRWSRWGPVVCPYWFGVPFVPRAAGGLLRGGLPVMTQGPELRALSRGTLSSPGESRTVPSYAWVSAWVYKDEIAY